jgi:hypothetical protein
MLQKIKAFFKRKTTSLDVLTPQNVKVICPRGYAAYRFGNIIIVSHSNRAAERLYLAHYKETVIVPNRKTNQGK